MRVIIVRIYVQQTVNAIQQDTVRAVAVVAPMRVHRVMDAQML